MAKEAEVVQVRFFSSTTGKCFLGFFVAFEVLLVLTTIMVGVWMAVYRDGYDWYGSNPKQQFSFHPLFMYIGLVFLYGNGIMVFRFFRHCDKLPLKILHTVIQGAALIFAAVGLAAAFDMHNRANIPNMYSLHSWLGLITVILFGLQWLIGFLTFLLPFAPGSYRTFLRPIHIYYGVMLFILAIATSFTGMTELLIFNLGAEKYSYLPAEGVFANCLSLFMGLIMFIGAFLVASFGFRRIPDEEK